MTKTLAVMVAVAALAMTQAAMADNSVPGEKQDSGLGSMVYGESLDSGLGTMVYGESLDSGLGELTDLDMQPYMEKAAQIQTASVER